MKHPFPLPVGLESEWTAKQWQQAANFYWYERMGVERVGNYRPTMSLLETAYKHAVRMKRMKESEIS